MSLSHLFQTPLLKSFFTALKIPSWSTYTETNSKFGFWQGRTSAASEPPVSLNLFKLSCFGAASLLQIYGAGLAKFPNFECISGDIGITISWEVAFKTGKKSLKNQHF